MPDIYCLSGRNSPFYLFIFFLRIICVDEHRKSLAKISVFEVQPLWGAILFVPLVPRLSCSDICWENKAKKGNSAGIVIPLSRVLYHL